MKMKGLVLVFLTVLAAGNFEEVSIPTENLQYNYIRLQLEELLKEVHYDEVAFHQALKAGSITAEINDFADRLIANIQQFMILNGLDPIELPDQTLSVLVGSMTMTNGWLQETATIQRNGDVIVSYSTSTRILDITVPLTFKALMFTYDYHTKVLLLSIRGGVNGKVSNLKLNMHLNYDFNTNHFVLKDFNIKDTGKFDVNFTGNGLVDWLTNAMIDVVSFVLHPLIVSIIQGIVQGPINSIFDLINGIIDSILHPTTVSAIAGL